MVQGGVVLDHNDHLDPLPLSSEGAEQGKPAGKDGRSLAPSALAREPSLGLVPFDVRIW